MSVSVDVKPEIKFAPQGLLYPFTGYFIATQSLTGAAGGGTAVINVRPDTFSGRIYVVDNVFYGWSAAITASTIRFHSWANGKPFVTMDIIDTSGGAGFRQVPIGQPIYWHSSNKEDRLVSVLETNVDTVVTTLTVLGRFYDPDKSLLIDQRPQPAPQPYRR